MKAALKRPQSKRFATGNAREQARSVWTAPGSTGAVEDAHARGRGRVKAALKRPQSKRFATEQAALREALTVGMGFWHHEAVGVTRQQLERMQERLDGGHRSKRSQRSGPEGSVRRVHQVIMGIDPSLRGTGYGVIRVVKPYPETLAQGMIRCPAGWGRSRCLVRIAQVLREILQAHQPTVCAVEGLFYAQNLQTALIMGEARGACLLMAAEAGLEIYEIAARKVKQAVVGYGAAQKVAVAKMVQRLLHLQEPPAADAADALALALTFVQENRGFTLSATLSAPRRI